MRNQSEQEGGVASRRITLSFEGQLGGMAREKVESDVTPNSDVLGRVPSRQAGGIVPKRDIERPENGMFKGAVGGGGVQKELGIGRQTGNEGRRFGLDVAPSVAFTLDHPKRL